MASSGNPAPWEIWLAYVRFADHPEIGKVRPVVILDSGVEPLVVAKITTANPQEAYTYCELIDWEYEGLVKPSRVQIAPLFQLALSDLLNTEPLGKLTKRDRNTLGLALDAPL